MFPATCATTFLSEPARVGDSHIMPFRSQSEGGIPSRAIGLPGIMVVTLGVNPEGCLGPTLTIALLKLQTYLWIKSPLYIYGTSDLLPLSICS